MSDYCLYPKQCGLGFDCSECHQKRIEQLEAEVAELRGRVDAAKKLPHAWRTREWVSISHAEAYRLAAGELEATLSGVGDG